MDITTARQIAARIWCDPEFSRYSMNPELAENIACLLLGEAISQSYRAAQPYMHPTGAAGTDDQSATDTRASG